MTLPNMDICLNISKGPTAGATKVQRSKAAFFKPQVKRLVKKSRLANKEKPKNSTTDDSSKFPNSATNNNSKKVRVKQKSLAAIVAKNIARSKTVTFRENSNAPKKRKESGVDVGTLRRSNEQIEPDGDGTKPLVSFCKPTKENALKTILARVQKSDETRPKKSLSDIFAKNSGSSESQTKLLSASPKISDAEAKEHEKIPRSFNEGDEPNRDRLTRIPKQSQDKQGNSAHSKPFNKVSSLFGNNPEVPNIGQRLVKPVNEAVFSETTFAELGIHAYSVSNLEQNMGISTTTTVQHKAIPVILSGRNVLIRSQTGSGKTLSYALPIVETLHRIRPKLTRSSGLRALVVVPTRELALQTYECFIKLVKPFTWIVPGYLVGGEKRKAEKARLRRGCTVLIATPGRLLDHIKHTEALKLSGVECFVLDEADRMLDMGYEKDISDIVEALKRQFGASVENSSYDPLALVRNSGNKKTDGEEKNDTEGRVVERPETEKDEENSENSGEESKASRKCEYHSGTDSDEDDQEFLIRKKKKNDTPSPRLREDKIVSKESKDGGSESECLKNSTTQTILLSATLTAAVEKLAGLTMTNPVFVDAAQDNLNEVGGDLNDTNEDLVVPQRVTQSYIVVPAKLRMVTLSAYIAGRCQVSGQHKTLVFMATQDMVDYHVDVLSTVLGKPRDDSDLDSEPLVDVEFFKLHGKMSQKERTEVFKTFRKARSGVLLCTDVASRGLDMPKVDTIIQYTGPLSARDYVHRIGRTGRAGTSGASTIFLTPSEIDFVRMLESRRIRIKQESMEDTLDKLVGPLSMHKSVEATATALQNEFETLVLADKNFHAKACKAYISWIRFYASYPRDMREIFDRKDLHLGHYAKSFALRDPPQRIGGIGKTLRDKESAKPQHDNRLSNERSERQTQRTRQKGHEGGQKVGFLKKSRMLNTSEYDSGLEPVKKSRKSH